MPVEAVVHLLVYTLVQSFLHYFKTICYINTRAYVLSLINVLDLLLIQTLILKISKLFKKRIFLDGCQCFFYYYYIKKTDKVNFKKFYLTDKLPLVK